ncbi:hypothetical protein MMC30_002163 [Trapelia coarctata]|nr:hypothetical protein [Trapelia coarctata]
MVDDMAAIKAAKSDLRKVIHQKLKQLTQEDVALQSHRVRERLFAMPEYQSAKNISVYLSMPNGEVSTRCIVEDALRKGKGVFVPYLYKERTRSDGKASAMMDMVSLHSELDYNSLQPDKWGIPTVDRASIPDRTQVMGAHGKVEDAAGAGAGIGAVLDMMVMPGLAFDGERRRLGHGKGYYDFFLHRYQERLQMMLKEEQFSIEVKMPHIVALALIEQFLPEEQIVPTTPLDYQLDAVVVGDGSLHHSGN